MTACDLLQELQRNQVILFPDGETLQYRAPKGVLTPALRQAITAHKAKLLVLLTQEPTAPVGCVLSINPQSGQRFITRLYRCPACGGTHWGPRADGMWHCLTCARAVPHG